MGRPLLQSKSMVRGDCFLYCTNFVCVLIYTLAIVNNISTSSERLKPSQQMAKCIITNCIFSTLKEMIVSTVDSEESGGICNLGMVEIVLAGVHLAVKGFFFLLEVRSHQNIE